MKEYFSFDDRLGIHVPDLDVDWEYYKMDTQQTILFQWEQIRSLHP